MDIVALFVSILYGVFVFIILFAACELGERLGNIFIEFDDEIGQLNWYIFPFEVQKLLPIIVINTHKPVIIKCFGSVAGTRRQFQKVYLIKKINLSIQSNVRSH